MPRSFLTKTILLVILVLSISILYWSLNREDESTPLSLEQEKSDKTALRPPFRIKGISFSSYDDKNNLVARLEADEFRIDQRRFWIFNIRPFNEAVIDNARFDLYLEKDGSSEADIYSSTKKLLNRDLSGSGGKGIITRGVINGIRFNIFISGKLSLSVSADRAYIDLKKKKMKLLRATIKDIMNERLIKSDLAFWNYKDKTLDIPGEYRETVQNKVSGGKGLSIKLN